MRKKILTGPFRQLLTMNNLPQKGCIADGALEIIEDAGIIHQDGLIEKIGSYLELTQFLEGNDYQKEIVEGDSVALPGFVDPHTHICWEGSRENDYAQRLNGISYLEIAKSGGGISYSVAQTRASSTSDLENSLTNRAMQLSDRGVTTVEVKSGYGLDFHSEIKILEVIEKVNQKISTDLIPTCLAAHIVPKDFSGNELDYLNYLLKELLPVIRNRSLARRIDIFVDEGAFSMENARFYLNEACKMGFDRVVHGEQFSSGGVELAIETRAKSVDHLEVINDKSITSLARSEVTGIALPGASIGLGCNFAPVRKMLDAGCAVAFGSDWNPGSAPMGDLLLQSAIIGVYEKITMAETLAAITCRSALALGLSDRGVLTEGYLADFISFPAKNYKEILYYQGSMKPNGVWKKGIRNFCFFPASKTLHLH